MSTLPQTISTSISSISHPQLVAYSTTLLNGVENNENYPTLQKGMAEHKTLFANYATAAANAAKGGEAAKLLRDSLRPEVEAIIRFWSAEASTITPNDPVAWAGAHFRLTKPVRQPRQPLPAPAKALLADGHSKGGVRATQNAQKTTRAYVYEYAVAGAEGQPLAWHYCLCPKNTAEITGLVSGQQYWFRMGAWNGTGDTAFSPAELRYVQ